MAVASAMLATMSGTSSGATRSVPTPWCSCKQPLPQGSKVVPPRPLIRNHSRLGCAIDMQHNSSCVLRLTPQAEADLEAIWRYGLAEWSADQADRYVDGLLTMLDFLCGMPEIARERMELSPPVPWLTFDHLPCGG